MKKRILCTFLFVVFLVSVFCVSASAETTYTEYTQYSGFAFSDSVREIISGYAYNYINSNNLGYQVYNYWVSARVDEYKYIVLFFDDFSDIQYTSTGFVFTDGECMIYDERAHSYTDSYRTYYQSGISYNTSYPIYVNVSYMNVIGNFGGAVNITYSDKSYAVDIIDSLRNILICLLFFLLLFVAFKFLNKRWLLP